MIPPRRPWYRLHASTWVAALLILGSLCLTAFPGQCVECSEMFVPLPAMRQYRYSHTYEYGWPWTWRSWTRFSPINVVEGAPGWVNAEGWLIPAEHKSLRTEWESLARDILVVFTAVCSLVTAIEWRRRRHVRVWQFSVRELGGLVALIAGVLGWWEWERREFARDRSAIQRLQKIGCGTETAYFGPLWLERLAGIKLPTLVRVNAVDVTAGGLEVGDAEIEEVATILTELSCLEELDLSVSEVTDDGLVNVGSLAELKTLRASCPDIGDQGMTHLIRLRSLEVLDLSGTKITDRSADVFVAMPKLRELCLRETAFGDAGLARLAQSRQLEILDLDETRVTDVGLAQLPMLPQLRELTLSGPKIGRAALSHVARVSTIEVLTLSSAAITDDDLRLLEALPRLRELYVWGTPISDKGLEHVARLKSLRTLVLHSKNVTKQGMQRLRERLPDVSEY